MTACKARSLEGGNENLACEENSPSFGYATLGNSRFYPDFFYLDATLTPITTNGAPSGRVTHSAVWTGSEMIVWGGVGPNFLNTGARYNPATGLWTAMTTSGAPTARNGHAAVWTGTQMVVWGGLDGALVNTGARYNPANNTWTATSTNGAPAARTGAPGVWTGTEMLVWGGIGGSVASESALSTGGRYNSAANTWPS